MEQEPLLVKRACAGDPNAFDQLVSPHLDRAYRLARLITRDRDAADDAVQETLRAFRSLRNLESDRPFSPWFTRILVNEAIKQTNRWHRLMRWIGGVGSLLTPVPAESPDGLLQARKNKRTSGATCSNSPRLTGPSSSSGTMNCSLSRRWQACWGSRRP